MPSPARTTPTVFISYSRETPEHIGWIKSLASALRACELKVILDEEDLSPAQFTGEFMRKWVQKATWVVCICTKEYARRAKSVKNAGVASEAMWIEQRMTTRKGNTGVVPLSIKGAKLPDFLSAKIAMPFSTNAEADTDVLKKLVDRLGGTWSSLPVRLPNSFRSALILLADIVRFSDRQPRIQEPIITGLWSILDAIKKDLRHAWTDVFPVLDGVGIVWDDTSAHESVIQAGLQLIERTPRNNPPFEVRVGLHQGPYTVVRHALSQAAIFVGSGLNDGHRIAALGDGKHLLISESFFHDCSQFDETILRDKVFPRHSDPSGIPVFAHRLQAGTVRVYCASSTNSTVPERLNVRDTARQSLEFISEDISQTFATLLELRHKIDPADSRPRVTLWVVDPLTNQQLNATDFRYNWGQKANGHPAREPRSSTVYSLEGEGTGPAGRAFRQNGRPFVLHDLPDWASEPERYIRKLTATGLTPEQIRGFSSKSRTFVCCSFPLSTAEQNIEGKGVVCIDLPHPCRTAKPLDLENHMREVMELFSRELALFFSVLN